jgi:predicted protein tyrosine phosphatase
MKTHILFICMSGIDRSPCATEIVNKDFSDKFEAKFAGVSPLADVIITKQAVVWADKIICMEKLHREMLFEQFPEARDKDVEVWYVSSDYCRGDEELERELRERIGGSK